jgi:pantetheine-phosphate adenylyltransferase
MSGNAARCVCPGSYDPITNGHLDVIKRASALYDEVVVAILHNTAKQGTFSPQERIDLIGASTADMPNVRALAFGDRLIVDVCRELDAGVLVKGIRGLTDYEYELPMALMNREMSGVETLLLPADPAYTHYSSSLIRLIAGRGADIRAMVPEPVLAPLLAKLRPESSEL